MRNEVLDKVLPIDDLIGELLTDNCGDYRWIKGVKVYQIKELTQRDIDANLFLNRSRASGIRPHEYLRSDMTT